MSAGSNRLPNSCAWTTGSYLPTAPLQVSPRVGTGSQRITYVLGRATPARRWDIVVSDSSGRSPSTVHQVLVGTQ